MTTSCAVSPHVLGITIEKGVEDYIAVFLVVIIQHGATIETPTARSEYAYRVFLLYQ
jgi:hypothetical protein